MGRPTKYNMRMIDKVYEYMATCSREATELPTMEGLAACLEVNADTLVEWAKIHPSFSAAIKALHEKQRNQLVNDGMYGGKEVNSTMAIFLLKANHGMIETNKVIEDGTLNVKITRET